MLYWRDTIGELIMLYKLLSGIYGCNIACQLVKPTHFITRGHYLRLFKKHDHYNLQKLYFGKRIVSNWNSLSDNITNANTIGIFENRLDCFLSNQASYYDYKDDVTWLVLGVKVNCYCIQFFSWFRSSLSLDDANIEAVACLRYSSFRFCMMQ